MNMEKSKTFSERKSLVSEEEQPYKLPDNWCWTKIKYICNLYNGKSFKSSDWVDNGLPIVRIQNLNNPNAEYNYYNGEVEEKFYLKGEELLFAWSGTPGTSFGAHIWKNQEAVLNQHIFKIVFDEERIDKVYLMYAINQQLNTLISNVHGGAGLQHITKRDFEETLIPLAPLSEQKRIIWRIEDMFDKLNEAKQMLQGAIENVDIFKKNILHDAFSGKLTEQSLDFLREYLNISSIESILFVLKKPTWNKKGVYRKDEFWGARGVVRSFLDDLYRLVEIVRQLLYTRDIQTTSKSR